MDLLKPLALAALAGVVAFWGAACRYPDIADGAFACGAAEPRCPPDFSCADDGRCHREPGIGEAGAGGTGGGGAGGEGGEGGAVQVCGDLTCEPALSEDCVTCEGDCGPCAATCGDAECVDESCVDCPGDCGVCPPDCGDGRCGRDEDELNCPADC